MKNLLKYIAVCLLLTIFHQGIAQDYCLQFSKKNRSVIVEKGKKVSFETKDEAVWKIGVIKEITLDSIFIEEPAEEKELLEEREFDYIVSVYSISEINSIAYPTTTSVAKGTSVAILLTATVVVAAVVGGGSGIEGVVIGVDGENVPSRKFFKKNIRSDKGWVAEIVLCE